MLKHNDVTLKNRLSYLYLQLIHVLLNKNNSSMHSKSINKFIKESMSLIELYK